VSRRPRQVERELLVNRTSQDGTDLTGWLAIPMSERWSWTMLAGYHGQQRQDLDADRWSDLAAFDRGLVRPRLFYDNGQGRSLFVTAGMMAEDRAGGTEPGGTAPDGEPFQETLTTRHADAGAVARWLTAGGRIVSVRGSVMRQSRDRVFGGAPEHGVRMTMFGEAALTGVRGPHTWVAGAAIQYDRFALREQPAFDYRFSTPSLFVQDEMVLSPRVSIAASARADAHSEYGLLATPRLSVLVRPDTQWTVRVSAGTGAFTPTPFTEETDETGLSRLRPPAGLRAERAIGGSIDVTRTFGPVEITGTAFGSRVRDPLQHRAVADGAELVNAAQPTRTWGTELIGRYRVEGFVFMATHGWTRSTEFDPDPATAQLRREVPLTPRHAASMNGIWEGEDWGRLGVELYFTGRQALEHNPYQTAGTPHWLLGVLGERRFGRARLFVNAENLFDVRLTKEHALVLPARLSDGRWTVDAWAPLDGRVVNAGIRVGF
jgi:iron complex outermembrane receptor protein